jgi:hypothetical protein
MTPKGTVVVDLAEWVGRSAWAGATDAARSGAMALAVEALLGTKRRQVLAGRGADGQPMRPRKHPREDGADGPVLAPHRVDSRAILRLRHSKVGSGKVVIWWGDGWSRILGYHARGLVRHAPIRNVVDFTPDALARIRRKVQAWWRANGEERIRVGPPAVPKGPAPGRGGLADGVRFVKPDGAGLVVVLTDVAKLEAALSRDALFHVGRGGSGAAIPGRYPEATRFLTRARSEGIAVVMPKGGIDPAGAPYIEDGRHRLAVLRDSGAVAVPIAVPRGEAARFRRRFGAT